MSFLYPFLNFLQPGILWQEIAEWRPMLVASALAFLAGLFRKADFSRNDAWTHPAFVWMVVFMVLQVLSVYYTGMRSMVEELGYWYIYPMFVVISILLASNIRAMKRYVYGMILGGMFVVAVGIYSVPAQVGWGVTGRAGAYGMYENHNDYTFIILQILPYSFMYMRTTRSAILRLLLAISVLLCALGVFMSLSRGGVLALMLEFLLIVLLGMRGKRRLLLIPLIAMAAVAAISYQWTMREQNQGDSYTAADAEAGRFELWKAGFLMGLKHPLLGTGSRRFSEHAHEYYDLSHSMRGKVSHNTYVEVLAGTGFVGLGAFLAIFFYLARELHAANGTEDPWLDATRRATLIGLYTVLFRGMLDAKPHDWSLYVFCSMGLVCILLGRKATGSGNPEGSERPSRSSPAVSDRLSVAKSVSHLLR